MVSSFFLLFYAIIWFAQAMLNYQVYKTLSFYNNRPMPFALILTFINVGCGILYLLTFIDTLL